MITFPNAKINIGLYVTSRRPDGYHNLETLFYPIDLCDILEIVPSQRSETTLSITGITVDGDAEQNLVMRAYRLLQSQFALPAVDIHLHKVIPFGAGLGGGSADAAYTLRMLRDMFHLPLDDKQLATLAAKLGADCPFFIYNRPLIATGIGNCFASTDLSLKGKYIVLVKPSIAISTAEAYAHVTPQTPLNPLEETLHKELTEWKHCIANDFEKSLFPTHPRIAAIKQHLYDMGAIYASMSGSGSSVFGIFDQPITAGETFDDCFVWTGECKV